MRQVELVQLQEESVGKQEAKKYEIQKQIEAERRATEQYRVCTLRYLHLASGELHVYVP